MTSSARVDIPAEIEAHLINSSDWLREEGTLNLGTLQLDDDDWSHPEYYVLYALVERNGSVSFGAHFGDEPWDYISYEICLPMDERNFIAPSKPIATAVSRYLMYELQKSYQGTRPGEPKHLPLCDWVLEN